MLVVITGPPCVGKSTYVSGHASAGDIVIDLDRLALALSAEGTASHDYPEHIRLVARAARAAAIDAAIEMHRRGLTAWIIDALPSGAQRALYHRRGAKFVDLAADAAILAERAAQWPARNQQRIAALNG